MQGATHTSYQALFQYRSVHTPQTSIHGKFASDRLVTSFKTGQNVNRAAAPRGRGTNRETSDEVGTTCYGRQLLRDRLQQQSARQLDELFVGLMESQPFARALRSAASATSGCALLPRTQASNEGIASDGMQCSEYVVRLKSLLHTVSRPRIYRNRTSIKQAE